MSLSVKTKRVYETSDLHDGYRVLVDRIWPRGISKERANISEWWKEYAPSRELRIWFNHDPKKWHRFKSAYIDELEAMHAHIADSVIRTGFPRITLVYSAKDVQHNQAIVLKDYIDRKILEISDA